MLSNRFVVDDFVYGHRFASQCGLRVTCVWGVCPPMANGMEIYRNGSWTCFLPSQVATSKYVTQAAVVRHVSTFGSDPFPGFRGWEGDSVRQLDKGYRLLNDLSEATDWSMRQQAAADRPHRVPHAGFGGAELPHTYVRKRPETLPLPL